VNQYHLYKLAVGLYEIPGFVGDVGQAEARYSLTVARDALLPYLGDNPPIQLTVSLGAAKEFLESIETLLSELKNPFAGLGSPPDEPTTVEGWRFYDLRMARQRFEAVLHAECESRPAFIPPKRGIYDTEELVNTAENAISPALRPMLSEKAAVELGSAGRCLAFGLFTAAGFHMCRAVEAVLENTTAASRVNRAHGAVGMTTSRPWRKPWSPGSLRRLRRRRWSTSTNYVIRAEIPSCTHASSLMRQMRLRSLISAAAP
jgi:hypothetical protein